MAFPFKDQIRAGVSWLGKNESAVYAVILTCVADAFIKPFITLHNKNKPWNERFYAAERETVHHINAIPNVALFSGLFEGIGQWMMAPAFHHLPPTAMTSSLGLVKKNVFGNLGIIAANFAIPVEDNIVVHPVNKILQPWADQYLQPMIMKGEAQNQPGAPTTLTPATTSPPPVLPLQTANNIVPYRPVSVAGGIRV